ncbi:MAG: STAS domain-containing protein [bacterium]|nr:STAS domain-containing protein [bacterium]
MKVKATKNKISLDGEMIFENAETGKELLLAVLDKIDSSKAVTIDFSKVREIDTSGFQLLLAFIHTLASRDISFKIKKVRSEVFDLVNLAGMNKFLKIEAADVIRS